MAKDSEVLVQLATRIPKALHREVKLHCVQTGISLMDFVTAALGERLRRRGSRPVRRSGAR